jgi:hypothetical protein
LLLPVAGIALAQAEEYILLQAVLELDGATGEANPKKIQVAFGGSFPDDSLLNQRSDWLVQKLDKNGSAPPMNVDITNVMVDRRTRVIVLTVAEAVNPTVNQIRIYYRHGDLPSVVLNQPRKVKAAANFKPANGKKEADIYFSGTAVGARESKPLYSFESKLGYLKQLGVWGALGGKATADASEESNLDPDSITFSAAYRKVFVLSPLTGVVLQSGLIGGEFDKENRTRNLASGLDAILVLPPAYPTETSVASINFLAGFEGGHNYRHKLNEKGLGKFWRWKMGTIAYLTFRDLGKLNRLGLSADYVVRLPTEAELFSSVRDGKKTTVLTTKARHHIAGNVDFMFSDALGITLQYRYGSLPPAYNLVNNSVSIGLTFQLKQVK